PRSTSAAHAPGTSAGRSTSRGPRRPTSRCRCERKSRLVPALKQAPVVVRNYFLTTRATALVTAQPGSVALVQPAGATAVAGLWPPACGQSRSVADARAWKHVVLFRESFPVAFHVPLADVVAEDCLGSDFELGPREMRIVKLGTGR